MGRCEASRPVDDRLRWRRALFFFTLSFFPFHGQHRNKSSMGRRCGRAVLPQKYASIGFRDYTIHGSPIEMPPPASSTLYLVHFP